MCETLRQASMQICMQTCVHQHPDPSLRIMAVVTACYQEARRAQRKFTPILLFSAFLLFIAILLVIMNLTDEFVKYLPRPARHGVSVIAWVG